jgi:L-ascorbate metabolism protein UlaG (beta-lactamase superfamily)
MKRDACALCATMRTALAMLLVAACGAAPARPRAPARHPIQLTYLGVAGWQISDGTTTILVDPYVSRGPFPADDAPLVTDDALVAAHAPAHADLIVVGHSHFDHLLDTPAFARRTGAQVMGSESTTNYARASGVAADHLITIKGGEDYDFGAFSVRVIPSLHSALDHKHGFGASRTIAADARPPLVVGQFGEGGTFAYLIRLGGHEILVLDTANFIERELDGLRPDVAIVAPGARQEIHDYACRLVHALGAPPLVLATHFDAWTQPLGPHQMDLDDDARRDLARFGDEIHACAPAAKVMIPAHGRAITAP